LRVEIKVQSAKALATAATALIAPQSQAAARLPRSAARNTSA